MDDVRLLQEFARDRSQEAFATLVSRHIDLVYSAALRQLHDPAAAQDATQAVFLLLAQKAHRLTGTQLSAWLFATTRYVCANARRKQARRTLHERKAAEMRQESDPPESPAWDAIAPLLDEAIDSLPATEKRVVLMRYFEKRSFREVGEQFEISEDAARKRVERAVDKLRGFFARAGVATPASMAAIDAVLLTHAVTHAPAALAQAVAAKAAVAGSLGTWGTFMAATTAKKVAAVTIGVLLLAGGTVAVVAPAMNRSAPAIATPQGRTVALAAPPMTITTSGGVVVDFLALSTDGKNDPWWAPDGTPLKSQPFTTSDWMRETPQQDYPGKRPSQRMEFAFRARYNDEHRGDEPIYIRPVFGLSTTEQMWETPMAVSDNPGLSRVMAGWEPPVPRTMKVTIGVASGSWTTAAESTTPTMPVNLDVQVDKLQQKMTFRPITLEDPKNNPSYAASTQPGATATTLPTYAELVMVYSPNVWSNPYNPQSRTVAVVDGKEIVGETRRAGGLNMVKGIPQGAFGEVVAFKTAPEKITAIRWQIRKYEPVVFDNVSLRSGEKTEPKVTLRPVGEPMEEVKPRRRR
jgi:RNA polymerase sigma factor (sigma-70 family)